MRFMGPMRLVFKGDEEAARQHITRARAQHGLMREFMAFRSLPAHVWRRVYSDGTTIVTRSGYGIDEATITTVAGGVTTFEGCPYHGRVFGTYGAPGTLQLPNGEAVTYTVPVGGDTQVIVPPGAVDPSRSPAEKSSDLAAGYQWFARSMLSGWQRQICEVDLGASNVGHTMTRVLMWDEDKQPYLVKTEFYGDTGRVVVTLERSYGVTYSPVFNLTDDTDDPALHPTINRVLLDVTYGLPTGMGAAAENYNVVRQSPDGRKIAVQFINSTRVERIVEITLAGVETGGGITATGVIVHDKDTLYVYEYDDSVIATHPTQWVGFSPSTTQVTYSNYQLCDTVGSPQYGLTQPMTVTATRDATISLTTDSGAEHLVDGSTYFYGIANFDDHQITSLEVITHGCYYEEDGTLTLIQGRTATDETTTYEATASGTAHAESTCTRSLPCDSTWTSGSWDKLIEFTVTWTATALRQKKVELVIGNTSVDSITLSTSGVSTVTDTGVNSVLSGSHSGSSCESLGWPNAYDITASRRDVEQYSHRPENNSVVTNAFSVNNGPTSMQLIAPQSDNMSVTVNDQNVCVGALRSGATAASPEIYRMYGPLSGGADAVFIGEWQWPSYDWLNRKLGVDDVFCMV